MRRKNDGEKFAVAFLFGDVFFILLFLLRFFLRFRGRRFRGGGGDLGSFQLRQIALRHLDFFYGLVLPRRAAFRAVIRRRILRFDGSFICILGFAFQERPAENAHLPQLFPAGYEEHEPDGNREKKDKRREKQRRYDESLEHYSAASAFLRRISIKS